MKKTASIVALATCATALCGCVSRTVTVEPQHRGEMPKDKSYGSDPHSKVVKKGIIWIWQDEYRNAK